MGAGYSASRTGQAAQTARQPPLQHVAARALSAPSPLSQAPYEESGGTSSMAHQVAVTVRAPVLDGHREALEGELHALRAEGPGGPRLPLRDLAGTHFARLFVLDGFRADDGEQVPDTLLYMADVDGSATAHLRELLARGADGLDAVLGHCAGWPAGGTPAARLAYLQAHALRPAAYYVHTVGRTVPQVRAEAELAGELAQIADALPAPDPRPLAVRRAVRQALAARPGTAWALRKAPGPGALHRAREAAHAVGVPLVVLPLLPVLLPVVAGALVAIRLRERTDPVERGPADPAHVDAVEAYEDHGAQNAFTAAGRVKPGRLRATTMRVALFGLDYACRHVYNRDHLAGVRTIHFARWQPLDGGRRVLFASAYDGSQESYMDDFIDRLSWGVNLVFSNGAGYPRTRWLLLDGAHDEVSYKQYLRTHQVPTTVFWSAYDTLPAHRIDTAGRLRDGLSRALDPRDAARWVAAL